MLKINKIPESMQKKAKVVFNSPCMKPVISSISVFYLCDSFKDY